MLIYFIDCNQGADDESSSDDWSLHRGFGARPMNELFLFFCPESECQNAIKGN